MAKKIISITEGRKNLFKIAEEVQKPDTFYIFTVDGKPRLVLMSQDEFDSIMETIEILSNPEILEDIKKAEEEIDKGEYVTWDAVKKELGLAGCSELLLRERPKQNYKPGKKQKKKYGSKI